MGLSQGFCDQPLGASACGRHHLLRQHLYIAELSAWWQQALIQWELLSSSLVAHRGSATLYGAESWLRPHVPSLACLGLNPSFATYWMCDLVQVT